MVAESTSTPLPSQGTPAQLLGELVRLVRDASCAQCGDAGTSGPAPVRPTATVPAARAPYDGRLSSGELDSVGEEERWLWQLVEESERVIASAPAGPDPDQVALVEQRHGQACLLEQRINIRIKATQTALAQPSSWLRPGHRAELRRHLQDDRAAAVHAAMQRGRVEQVRHRLQLLSARRSAYLSEHRGTLSAGENARAELMKIVDDLIDGYARLAEPPAWFRFGLDFPPEPGTRKQWLVRAREALMERRRAAARDPLNRHPLR